MIDNLPEELKLQIIHKLPIKTIGQCTCLSKSWQSLIKIKSPSFISTLLKLTTSSNNHFLMFRTSSDQFALHSDNDEFDLYNHLNLPFDAQNRNFRDCGTCNGLICLIEENNSAIVLWNPVIKKTLTLPRPNIPRLAADYKEVFHGFGFDSSTNDYKLVRILSPGSYTVPAPEAEIFSLNRNSWTTVTQFAPKYNICQSGTHAFVNGVLHWVSHDVGISSTFRCQIVGFDIGREVFREIKLPEGMDGWIPYDMTVLVYKESWLAVCFHDFCTNEELEIWVMKEYGNVESWTVVWRLDWDDLQLPPALGFRNNGEVFLEVDWGIISVDIEKEEEKDVGIRDRVFWHDPINYYVESLVLLDNPNAVSYTIVPTDANISSDASEGSHANHDNIDRG